MEKEFKNIDEQIEILKNRNLIINECNAKNILKSNVIILKDLLDDTEFKNFYSLLIKDIEKIKKNIKSIDFNSILNKMGFPNNYKKLLNSKL